MFTVSHYYEQAQALSASPAYSLEMLYWTDLSTSLRETAKIGTVIGLVSSVSSTVFNFDPTFPLTWTAVCGFSWILAKHYTSELEASAQNLILHLKTLQLKTVNRQGIQCASRHSGAQAS